MSIGRLVITLPVGREEKASIGKAKGWIVRICFCNRNGRDGKAKQLDCSECLV